MESLGLIARMDWSGKRVFVTGHTGFKGAWLTRWLLDMGARVSGYSLEPNTSPSLFDQLDLGTQLSAHHIADIRDFKTLQNAISEFQPEVVFHLAAQPLVRLSYSETVGTWDSNVMGTVHVLEAVRHLQHSCNVVAITTDKVYENLETGQAYGEDDRLGGHDPYSASKAACEIVISSYRKSFFETGSNIRLASARAGNVIGGGDWALDRIVPDIVRALSSQAAIEVRNPNAVRPWQHVLDPLGGYIRLAELLDSSEKYCSAYNFGPEATDVCSVKTLVENALEIWPGEWRDTSDPKQLHEANLLSLSIDKARDELNWKPVWNFEASIRKTIEWYLGVENGADPMELCRSQIAEFRA